MQKMIESYAEYGRKLCRRIEDDRKLCRKWIKVMRDMVKSYVADSRKLCRRFSKVVKEGDGKVYAGDGYKLAPSRLADFFFLLFISRTLSLSGRSAYLTYLLGILVG